MRFILLLCLLIGALPLFGQTPTYQTLADLPYRAAELTAADDYVRERCVLDLYYPEGEKGFATVIWFHGGGLTGGNKWLPEALQDKGIAIIAPNYRFYPKVKAPTYIEDAAAAVAWVFDHIDEYGGDPDRIFVSGHSAGGYLASMIGLDKSYLATYGVDADRIAGLIPFSGHAITHFTVREERGIPGTRAIVDELAPLYHVRADAPPILLITGDRDLELLGRYEENAYLLRMLKLVEHPDVRLFELEGYGHGMVYPALPLLLEEVKRLSAKE